MTAAAAATLVLAPTALAADRTIRLKSAFETQEATASFRVPGDWQVKQRAAGVTLTAPSSKDGCDHVISADLSALYVSDTTTSAAWVEALLGGKGSLVAVSAPGVLSWGVVMKKGAATADGSGARVTGKGRYGPIMSEVLFATGLTGTCPDGQGAKAAKRLGRVLPSLTLTAVKR